MNYQEKVKQYKEYRTSELAMGRKPLNLVDWQNHMFLVKKAIKVS